MQAEDKIGAENGVEHWIAHWLTQEDWQRPDEIVPDDLPAEAAIVVADVLMDMLTRNLVAAKPATAVTGSYRWRAQEVLGTALGGIGVPDEDALPDGLVYADHTVAAERAGYEHVDTTDSGMPVFENRDGERVHWSREAEEWKPATVDLEPNWEWLGTQLAKLGHPEQARRAFEEEMSPKEVWGTWLDFVYNVWHETDTDYDLDIDRGNETPVSETDVIQAKRQAYGGSEDDD